MATPHACAALVDVVPDVMRAKRALAGASTSPLTATLSTVHTLGSPRVSELAEHLHLDVSTVSRQVTHLRQRGLLAACADPVDGRSQHLSLTAAGLDELRRSRRLMVDELVRRLTDWDDTDVGLLTTLLARLSRSGTAPTDTSHDTHLAPVPAPAPQENA